MIVTVGFAIGILWPRIAGFKLVPSVPSQPADSSSADLTGAPADAKGPAAAQSAAPPAEAEPPPAEAAPNVDRLQVSEPQFVTCKGKKHKDDCDHVEFDRVARPHIQALSTCPGAERAEGLLSLGFDLDFESQTIKAIKNGKSSTLPQPAVDALVTCAKKEFATVSLVGIAHQNESYAVFYKVEFPKPGVDKPAPGAEPADTTAPADITEATGHATVAWDVALVRSSASRDGAVVARVLQGTRVSVTGRRGDWYRIKYDVKGSVGWVYRTAIGM